MEYIEICGNYFGTLDNEHFLSEEKGKAAMEFINKYLFNYNSAYFITPFLRQNPLLNTAQDLLLAKTKSLFKQFLSENVINKLTNALYYSDTYNINTFREDLSNELFPELSGRKELSVYQMELQFQFLNILNEQLKENKDKNNAYTFQLEQWRAQLKDKLLAIKTTAREKNMTSTYYTYLLSRIQ